MNAVQVLNPTEVAAGFGDLPTLAPVAVEVLRLADDDRASLDDIADAISHDPGLTAQMLKVANSPMYGMGGEVASLNRAASILGLRTVKLLSLSFAVVASTGGGEDDAIIWRRTLAGAALGQTIANQFDRRLADETFIAGLLANIGRLALMKNASYAEANAAAGGYLETVAEAELVGTTGDVVAAEILRGWGLPSQLADAITYRSNPTGIDDTLTSKLARILYLADAGAGFIVADIDHAAHALDFWHQAAAFAFELDSEAADALIADAQEPLDSVAELFNSKAAAEQPVTDLLLRAREGLARLSLDVVAALSQEQTRADTLAADNERLAAEAMTDPLTGLPNRRAFDKQVEAIIAGHSRGTHTGRFGIMVLDLDHFKSVNDTYGHQVGDEVLVEVANRLQVRCRSNEFVARMGGEEFAVLLPSTTPEEVLRAGDGYRKTVCSEPINTAAGRLDVTTSVGVATSHSVMDETPENLYDRADRALYDAKHQGRNCVYSAD
ncbi:MAG: diguanylate cyclase [Actinomycetota bacterium]